MRSDQTRRPAPTARLAALAILALPPAARATPAAPPAAHRILEVSLSPDGTRLASVERDEAVAAPTTLVLTDPGTGARRIVALPCGRDPDCVPSAPVWREAPGGARAGLAFLVSRPDGGSEIDAADPATGAVSRLAAFDGPLDRLRAGPGGRLAVLATAHAHKKVGATAAARPLEGEIGADPDEQRIAVLEHGALRMVSPPGGYVYEFAWIPDGTGFVGTTAPGDGDRDWWVSRLARFDLASGSATTLFTPGPREQLASPVVSPDGRMAGFIGGWMSDFGSTGGDAYLVPVAGGAAPPRDVTPAPGETVTSLDWDASGLRASGIEDGADVSARIDPAGVRAPSPRLGDGMQTFSAGGWNVGLSCARTRCAASRQSFTAAPALVVAELGPDGSPGPWRAVSRPPGGSPPDITVRSIDWPSDGDTVQGWLLVPNHGRSPRPLVVDVHGGPEAAAEPSFPGRDEAVRALLDAGDAILLPNYRGSFGHGERFAMGSIEDVGGGDWRDVLGGLDAAGRATPIDPRGLGIMGGSYGGYMAMQAVASTHRFAAAVAIAGVSDWLSIEGEAPEAGADATNFGASVYDDPTPYLKASPVMHIRGATTPSLVLVGDRDAECPMPQSQEFATALAALHVPVSFYVYRDEGHGMTKPEDRADETRRVVAWFGRYLR